MYFHEKLLRYRNTRRTVHIPATKQTTHGTGKNSSFFCQHIPLLVPWNSAWDMSLLHRAAMSEEQRRLWHSAGNGPHGSAQVSLVWDSGCHWGAGLWRRQGMQWTTRGIGRPLPGHRATTRASWGHWGISVILLPVAPLVPGLVRAEKTPVPQQPEWDTAGTVAQLASRKQSGKSLMEILGTNRLFAKALIAWKEFFMENNYGQGMNSGFCFNVEF